MPDLNHELRAALASLATAHTPGDHRRAAAKLTRDIELADDSPEQTACDEADAEELRYQRSIASGRIKGAR